MEAGPRQSLIYIFLKYGGQVNGTQVKLIKADLNITVVGKKQKKPRHMKGEKNTQNKTGNSKQKP